MADPKVLIVGAGPTGLTLALWLTKLGIPIRIIDKLPAPAPFSRALGVQARTLELYRQLDDGGSHLAREAVESGSKVAGINFWTSGRRAAHIPFSGIGEGQSPFPFVLVLAQDAHERLLIRHLEQAGVGVERSTELVRFGQRKDGVRAILARDGVEETCEVPYIAGCDGARSAVRAASGTSFAGGTYSRLFYVADVDAVGPPVDSDIHIELDQADLLALFPMDGKRRVRMVGTMRDDAGEPRFEDVSRRAIERLKLTVEKVNWFSTYRVHHRVAGRFRDGRAFLLGDAAHIHSPVGAQGMNTGIGDAVNLAWKLASVIRSDAAESLLETYEQERIAFARRLVRTTDQLFKIASRPGRIAERVRTSVLPRVVPWLFRWRFFRAFLFHTVSQLQIRYRRSPLSEGKAGKIHGGDRLPWVPISENDDNFAFVSALRWQVHVYGETSDAIASVCSSLKLPLHQFAWREEMRARGFERDAVYLIRPDSYVALADSKAEPQRLRAYFEQRGIRTTGGVRG
ncbi:MAG TPA: FAD-dependent monooxygenase [Thermoanaerobaculia bacterium]|jgi:2-polyprenyl-6-methoxyphenol hydroxylase-like FAD-dependent oxidoreductase|nr:FAD-dependent monooxygenase [Thermoanaerobaculia bacterium]